MQGFVIFVGSIGCFRDALFGNHPQDRIFITLQVREPMSYVPLPMASVRESVVLHIIAESVTAAAALVGAVVAVIGLSTWRQQLTGKAKYKLARRLLRAVYKVRDEIAFVRAPFMSAGEIAEAAEEAELDVSTTADQRAIDAARSRRWQRLSSAMSDMEVEALEAEVLWGREVQDRLDALRERVHELHGAYVEYYTLRDEEVPQYEEDRRRRVELRRQMFGTGREGDDFQQSVADVVGAISEYLRDFLEI